MVQAVERDPIWLFLPELLSVEKLEAAGTCIYRMKQQVGAGGGGCRC